MEALKLIFLFKIVYYLSCEVVLVILSIMLS